MKKNEFISVVQDRANKKVGENGKGFTKDDIAKAIDAICEAIMDVTTAGDTVTLQNIGKFSVVEKAARSGVSPLGGSWSVPAHKEVAFKMSSVLKESLK